MSTDYATLRDAVKDGGYWYLGSPYSLYEAGIDAAWQEACKAAAALIRAGIPCYCRIAHTHPIAEHGGAMNRITRNGQPFVGHVQPFAPVVFSWKFFPCLTYGPAIRL